MILVDTSVRVDHLRSRNRTLVELLETAEVLVHPVVIGELALGNLRQRNLVLDSLRVLPQAVVAASDEILHFIELHALLGFGIGYVDAHLLAAARLTSGATLWMRDKRLRTVADGLGLATSIGTQGRRVSACPKAGSAHD